MDKKKVTIGIAVAAGLVVLFFLGKWLLGSKEAKREQGKTDSQTEERTLTLHRLRLYADSVGIDTTRYKVASSTQPDQIDEKLTRLLLEIRYGKKPDNLQFSGIKEDIDSAWAVHNADDITPELLTKTGSFEPYRQLVGQYNRLRHLTPSTTKRTDSLRQIRQTLNFYRYVNRFGADMFLVVNIPAAELNVFDKTGTRLLPMPVILGKPDRQTPSMTTSVQGIVAYPYWNVPRRIALEEMLPRMKRDLGYIYNQNLQILDEKDQELDPDDINWADLSATNFPYRVRQASGCENALGLLKFDLANPLAIYLHDTNSRDLFTQTTNHWRSHGCVRVQKPVELANLILGAKTFDESFMNKCLIDQKPRKLDIKKQIPVFITYNLADVDAAGKLRFYKDVYALAK